MVPEVQSLINRMIHKPFTCMFVWPDMGIAVETNIQHGIDHGTDGNCSFETADVHQDNWFSINPENISQVSDTSHGTVIATIKNTRSYFAITYDEEATV